MTRIPFLRPRLPAVEQWAPRLAESYSAEHFTNFGPLERRFAAACAERYAAPGYQVVTVGNATAGLTAALLSIPRPTGRPPRVAVPAFTFPATLHAALHAGFEVVLCDVDPTTWELDPACLERLAREQPLEAVVPVRSYGFVRDLGPVLDIAAGIGARVVVDGAAAFGHPGRAGAIGSGHREIEVVSLHATKTFAVGEGGLMFVPDELATTLRSTTNFGMASPSPSSFGNGGNMKLDEFHAAVGLAALEEIDEHVQERSVLAGDYAALFDNLASTAVPGTDVGATAWQCFPVRFASTAQRDAVESGLQARRVATRRYYTPALASGYRGDRIPWFDPAQTPVAERLAHEMLCLPIYVGMTGAERSHLMTSVAAAVAGVARFGAA